MVACRETRKEFSHFAPERNRDALIELRSIVGGAIEPSRGIDTVTSSTSFMSCLSSLQRLFIPWINQVQAGFGIQPLVHRVGLAAATVF
jgi:hypothetical protein